MTETASTPVTTGPLPFGQWFRTTRSIPALLGTFVGWFVGFYAIFGLQSIVPFAWSHTPLHEVAFYTVLFSVFNVAYDYLRYRRYRRSLRAAKKLQAFNGESDTKPSPAG